MAYLDCTIYSISSRKTFLILSCVSRSTLNFSLCKFDRAVDNFLDE